MTKNKKELKIEYQGLVCAICKHPIIWSAKDKLGERRYDLKHLNVEDYGKTLIVTISDDCKCGCKKAKD